MGMVIYTFSLSTWEIEARSVRTELKKAGLGYLRPSHKIKLKERSKNLSWILSMAQFNILV